MKKLILSIVLLMSLAEAGQAQILGDIFAGPKDGWWHDQWERLRVNTGLKIFDGDLGSVVGARVKYEYRVEPAFIKGLHQRQDAWIGEVNTNTSRLKLTDGSKFGVGGRIGAQVIFSRVFKTKTEAMTADIYWLNRIPWKSEHVEKALKEGDALRIETFLDMSAGIGESSILNDAWSLGGGISETRGVRFLADIYRMKNNRIRLRLIGQRNDGTESLGISINPTRKIDLVTGFIDKTLNRWFSCPILSVNFTNAELQDPPVDTQMADFVFDLNSADGRMAYDDVMQNMLKLRYLEVLNPKLLFVGRGQASEYITQHLVALLAQAEKIYAQDHNLPVENRRVNRIFKGKSRSAYSNQEFKSKCFQLWDLRGLNSSSRTYVQNYDKNENLSHQVFESSYLTATKSTGFSVIEETSRGSMDALFNATPDFSPTDMSDMVISTEKHDKAFRQSEYKDLKSHLAFILPQKTFAQIDWSKLENPAGTKNNVALKYDLIFHQSALDALPELAPSEVYTLLYEYIRAYPGRDSLSYDRDPLPREGYNNDPMDKFEYSINNLMVPIANVLNKRYSPAERMNGFSKVRSDQLFRQIGPGFLISLLPKDQVDKLLAFKIYVTASDNQGVNYDNNQQGLSPTFAAVQYILSLINDRGFDLRLQLDESGNVRPASYSPQTPMAKEY